MGRPFGIAALVFCVACVGAPHAAGAARLSGSQSTSSPTTRIAQDQAPKAATGDPKSGSNDTKEVTGLVTEASCVAGVVQRIDLKTASDTLHLRGPSGGKLPIENSSQNPADFNPCTALKGMQVFVRYTPDGANPQRGAIKSLRLGTPEKESGKQSEGQSFASDSGGSAAANSASEEPSTGNIPPQQLDSGTAETSEGKVVDVSCDGEEMIVTFSAKYGRLRLHARDYARVTYDDDRHALEDRDFKACTLLKGHTVAITFVVVDRESYEGEIQSVEVEK